MADICRQLGVSEATFYIWKKKYAHLGVTELRELRQLREENTRLKRPVADLTLDKQILSDVVKKRFEAEATPRARAMDVGSVSHPGSAGVSAGTFAAIAASGAGDPHPPEYGSVT